MSVIDDIGTYTGRGALQIGKPITAVVGPYRIDAVRYGGYAVVTNKTNQEPFRGAGMAAHNFVLERCSTASRAPSTSTEWSFGGVTIFRPLSSPTRFVRLHV